MEMENYEYRRFDVPPPDLNRMACCVNALIEVLELPIKKPIKAELQSVADAVKQITRNHISITSEGFVSILIQEIIDQTCRRKSAVRKVMELCEQKYNHLVKTGTLI